MDPRKLSALVVDDEPSLVRVVEGYLTKDGFDVRTAGDGERAITLARESEPDLVVLDLGLPACIPAVIADLDRVQEVLGTTLAELANMRPFKCPGNQASLGTALRARRNCDDETGSLACAVAVRREAAVVGLDDCAGDRQPET